MVVFHFFGMFTRGYPIIPSRLPKNCRLPLDDAAFATVLDAVATGGPGTAWGGALQLLREERELRLQVPRKRDGTVILWSLGVSIDGCTHKWMVDSGESFLNG